MVCRPNKILLVHGLDRVPVNCDRVFNLFCLYGNVNAVKVLRDDKALVEMEDGLAAERCVSNLHQMPLDDAGEWRLKVKYSKHSFIYDQVVFNLLPDDTPVQKDYSKSKLNRFTEMSPRIDRRRITNPSRETVGLSEEILAGESQSSDEVAESTPYSDLPETQDVALGVMIPDDVEGRGTAEQNAVLSPCTEDAECEVTEADDVRGDDATSDPAVVTPVPTLTVENPTPCMVRCESFDCMSSGEEVLADNITTTTSDLTAYFDWASQSSGEISEDNTVVAEKLTEFFDAEPLQPSGAVLDDTSERQGTQDSVLNVACTDDTSDVTVPATTTHTAAGPADSSAVRKTARTRADNRNDAAIPTGRPCAYGPTRPSDARNASRWTEYGRNAGMQTGRHYNAGQTACAYNPAGPNRVMRIAPAPSDYRRYATMPTAGHYAGQPAHGGYCPARPSAVMRFAPPSDYRRSAAMQPTGGHYAGQPAHGRFPARPSAVMGSARPSENRTGAVMVRSVTRPGGRTVTQTRPPPQQFLRNGTRPFFTDLPPLSVRPPPGRGRYWYGPPGYRPPGPPNW